MGSSRPFRSRWHFHHLAGSPGSSLGQSDPRYAIHASRQLSGEVLRYLKRVRVTPAIHRCFALLYQSLTYRHWADVSPRKHRCQLSGTCVFGKQSESAGHCDLLHPKSSRHPLYQRYGTILPISLKRIVLPHLSLLSHGHLCQIWVRSR